MQAERRKDRARQRLAGVDDRVITYAGQVQRAEHRDQCQQARHDAGKSPRIESAHIDPLETTPALQGITGDQVARKHEEHKNRFIAVAIQSTQQSARQHIGQHSFLQRDAQPEVVQHNQHDG